MAEILSGGLNWGSTQQAIVTMDKEGHPLTCCNPVTGECLGGGGSSDLRNVIQTINIPAQTLTGEQVEQGYQASVKIGELNTNLPIAYNNSYVYELFGAIDNAVVKLNRLFDSFVPLPEATDNIFVDVTKNPNNNDILLVAQAETSFSINTSNHTLVIYIANNTVLETFPGGEIISGK